VSLRVDELSQLPGVLARRVELIDRNVRSYN